MAINSILHAISPEVINRLQQENPKLVHTTSRFRDLVEAIYICESIFNKVEIECPDQVIENIIFYANDNSRYLRFHFYDGRCIVSYNQDVEVDDDTRIIHANQRFTQYRNFEVILNLFKANIVFC